MKTEYFKMGTLLILIGAFLGWAFTDPLHMDRGKIIQQKHMEKPVVDELPKVPYMDLLRMMAKYRDERQAIINNHYAGDSAWQYGINFQDSRVFTFDVQKLKDFIQYVETQIDENDLSVGFDAIRIYPVVYPGVGTSSYSDSIPFSQRNHLSLIMVAGFKDENGNVIEFDPDLYEAANQGGGNVPKSLSKSTGTSLSSFLNSLFGSSDSVRAFTALNHAGLCPPPNNCLTSFIKNSDVVCPNASACQY